MEDMLDGILGVVLVESGAMLALLLVWLVAGWLLRARRERGRGRSPRSRRGKLRARTACPNCGWRHRPGSVASPPLQVCPLCGLPSEDRPEVREAERYRRRRKSGAGED
jgi:hypothetical protein